MAQPSRKDRRSPIVRAAGGLLWRDGSRGPELALVHSPRRGTWCLPKGKLEDGESFAAAAIREVAEETACRVRLGEFAGYAVYAARSRRKLVLYWHMALVVARRFRPNGEIDALAWLPPEQAIDRLGRAHERRLVRSVLASRAGDAHQ